MTKQHFEAIAKIINSRIEHSGNECCVATIEWLAMELAEYLATTNELFDYHRFNKACGIREVK